MVAAPRAARHSTKTRHRVGRHNDRNLHDEGGEEDGGDDHAFHNASGTVHPDYGRRNGMQGPFADSTRRPETMGTTPCSVRAGHSVGTPTNRAREGVSPQARWKL